ncbi:MAG: aminotransferase class V-fold PLP-dependent enzyme [Pseudomonadota bacterium]
MSFSLFESRDIELLQQAVETLSTGFGHLPASNAPSVADTDKAAIQDAAQRMHDNYPYAHPLYAGQMLKPPHPVARAAYQMAMWVNPNNHALDGGRASSEMEKEAVAEIASMFGFSQYLGHLTSSGTLANLEALWIARETHPGLPIAGSNSAHYTHSRLSKVLNIEYHGIECKQNGRMDLEALESLASSTQLGTVVATAGTTSAGAVDPVHEITAMGKRYNFRVHVDAAYGGYFRLANTLGDNASAAYRAIANAHSVAIDPHKHGLQPYGCGCVVFSDPEVGKHYLHDSPYTYFSSDELHLGEISLECSRAGAAAVALWTTQKALPLTPAGKFAEALESSINAARRLNDYLAASDLFTPIMPPELDIVMWLVNAATPQDASDRAHRLFDAAAQRDLHLALIQLEPSQLPDSHAHWRSHDKPVACLRSCLMKAEHDDWLDTIWQRLLQAADTL